APRPNSVHRLNKSRGLAEPGPIFLYDAGMRIDPAGFPFIGISLAAGLAAGFWGGWPWASGLLVLTAFFLFFFRDPDRVVTAHPDAVLSPADGRVMVAGAPAGQGAPPGRWQQVSIFLSPMDVHVNRMPI